MIEIKEKVFCYVIGCCSLIEIDELNIFYVIMFVMSCVVEGLSVKFEFVFIDGNCVFS